MGVDFANPKIKPLVLGKPHMAHTSTGKVNGNIELQLQLQDCNDYQKYCSNERANSFNQVLNNCIRLILKDQGDFSYSRLQI